MAVQQPTVKLLVVYSHGFWQCLSLRITTYLFGERLPPAGIATSEVHHVEARTTFCVGLRGRPSGRAVEGTPQTAQVHDHLEMAPAVLSFA